jgi:hypothetical protein
LKVELELELQALLEIDTATLSKKRALKTANILLWELESSGKEQLRISIQWLVLLPQAKGPLNNPIVLPPLQAPQAIEGRVLKTLTPKFKATSI